MRNQIPLGRYFGVPVGLHISWFVIAVLIAMSVSQELAIHHPAWPPQVIWPTAMVTAILFFVSIVLHELAHSLVARASGIPVRAITLFALGGVSQIERESESPGVEFWIGIAGPATSMLIGYGCLLIARAAGWDGGIADRPSLSSLVWLGYINIGLAFFNLIPGFPLDGGRVLRSLIWRFTGDGTKATRWAARVGHWIAMFLIVMGILRFFTGQGFNGLWLAFIGWFLNDAAQASSLRLEWTQALKGLHVEDIMTTDCPRVPATLDVASFVEGYLLRTGRRCYLVEEGGRQIGVLTPEMIKPLDKSDWHLTPLRAVMRGFGQMPAVPVGSSAEAALENMMRRNVGQLAVVADSHVEGIVSRGHIMELVHTRLELN